MLGNPTSVGVLVSCGIMDEVMLVDSDRLNPRFAVIARFGWLPETLDALTQSLGRGEVSTERKLDVCLLTLVSRC